MEDIFKPTGTLQSAKPDSGGKAPIRTVPTLGVVKDNIDPNRSGRIFVYLSDNSGKDPNNSSNWVPVSYLSPFFGQTIPDANDTGFGTYKANPSSYGFWNSPPDIGTTVVCLFINGDQNYGFYIGAIPNPETLQMVPAIGATDNIIANSGEAESYGGALRLPVTNINTNNSGVADSIDFITAPKPIHSYVASIFTQQGLIRDPVRGPISTSAQRESPSRVGWGISTPGRPIYQGGFTDETILTNAQNAENQENLRIVSRRGGHSIVMDDGDLIGRDQLVRIRSALGHQILMSDDAQTLFIIHSNGQSYIELGKEGTVDIYSTNSFNVRTQGDLNLHADNNINIHAAKKLSIQSENFHINTDQEFSQRVGKNYNLHALGKILSKTDDTMSYDSRGESSFLSASTTFINGSRINLNTGKASNVPKEVKPVPIIAQTDTLGDNTKGYAAAPGSLLTIVSRAPAHAPWANANQGVDVKVSTSAEDNLPEPASQPVQQANEVAQSSQVTPTTVTTTSTVPNVPAVSPAIDKATTSVALSQMAVDAAVGPAKDAVKQGIGVVTEGATKTLSVGPFAMNPQQMEASGFIKPGSSALVQSLISAGKTPQQALPSSLFTGVAGVQNIKQMATNVTGQAFGVVRNLQQSQRALQQIGVLSGKESSVQSLGSVMATATQGIAQVTSTLRTVQGVSNIANAAIAGANGNVLGSLAAGTFAASLAQSKVKGLAGINQALNAANQLQSLSGLNMAAKGIAAAAFDKILGGFKPMKAGVPQNLFNIARQNAIAATGTAGANAVLGNNLSPGQLGNLANGVLTNTLRGATQSIASGLNNLPGGAKVAAAVVNNALSFSPIPSSIRVPGVVTNSLSSIPGLNNISGLAQNTGTSILNSLSPSNLLTATARTFAPAINPLLGSVNNLTNIANNLLPNNTQLKAPNALTGLANLGLPQSAIAQLSGSLSALNFGGGNPVRMPVVATGTFNRTGLDSQIVNVLGDPKIPPPQFSGTTNETAQSMIEESNRKLVEDLQKRKVVKDKFDKQFEIAKAAKKDWLDAKNSFPEGDPAVAELKQKFEDEVKKLEEIQKEFADLIDK